MLRGLEHQLMLWILPVAQSVAGAKLRTGKVLIGAEAETQRARKGARR
jgi:hypothetical protein